MSSCDVPSTSTTDANGSWPGQSGRRWYATGNASALRPAYVQPRPAIVGRPWSSLSASWHCTPAMMLLTVGVVGVRPPSISARLSPLQLRRWAMSCQSRLDRVHS